MEKQVNSPLLCFQAVVRHRQEADRWDEPKVAHLEPAQLASRTKVSLKKKKHKFGKKRHHRHLHQGIGCRLEHRTLHPQKEVATLTDKKNIIAKRLHDKSEIS